MVKPKRVVGLTDLHEDISALSPLLGSPLWLGQSPINLLELSWGQQQGRLVFQPMYSLQGVGMHHPWPHLWLDPPPSEHHP